MSWALLVLGIVLSVLGAWQTGRQLDRDARAAFDESARLAQTAIARRLQDYQAVLASLQGLYNTYGLVSQQEAERFLGQIQQPGGAGSSRLPGITLLDYLAAQPGNQDQTLPVYRPPLDAFGGDAPPVAAAASGTAISLQLLDGDPGSHRFGRMATVRGPGEAANPGLALRLPVYRVGVRLDTAAERQRAYLGTVGAWFDIPVVFREAMGSAVHRQLRLQLHMDAPAQAAGETMRRIPLFDSQPGLTDAAAWTRQHALSFAGHALQLTISSQPEHWQGQRWLSGAVLLAGIALSALVFLLVRQQLERRLVEHRLELAHYSRVITLGEMSSAIAHELRQPLAAILAYLDGCQRKLQDQRLPPGELLAILEKSTAQAQRAQTIIGRVQAAVKREKDHAQPRQPIRLQTLLAHVLTLARSEAQQAGVALELHAVPEHTLQLAAMDIELILLNLIRNAIQATRGQPDARVDIHCQLQQGVLHIDIRDNGPGISDTIMATLFEAHRTSKPDGTGMGLRLSRYLAEANAATLTAGTNTPRGAIFTLALPMAARDGAG